MTSHANAHVSFVPVSSTHTEREELVAFLTRNTFPFHVHPRRTEAEVRQALEDGAFFAEGERTLWVHHENHGRLGIVRLEDLEESGNFTPLFDIRLAQEHRGRGHGAAILQALTAYVFDQWPDVTRFEGQTRDDNRVMRRIFERCGWVQEAYYRESWPVEGGAPRASVAYAILRRDFETGTRTPVDFSGTQRFASGLHHLELWTANIAKSEAEWGWLLTALGWQARPVPGWELGRVWEGADATYLCIEQSPDGRDDRADRLAPGMNHVAFTVEDRRVLDGIRERAAENGWTELYAEKYPNAGGEDHVAFYAENSEGIEVEVVLVHK